MILKGQIVDFTSEPLMGVNIANVKGGYGFTTDYDGNYNFELDDDKSNLPLTISYIGFESITLKPSELADATITMKESNETLDEIIIYGTKKKPKSLSKESSLKKIAIISISAGALAFVLILVKLNQK
tara:strand:+ start:272 stop:655 length:384 start_codon:yes stop_codon:yes gene_type:complete